MNYHNLLLILCLLLTPLAYAYDLATALEHYEEGNYSEAYKQFSELALSEDSEAQYNLAFMYFGGEGVEQDDKIAAIWFQRAAKSGHAAAQDTLAYMYLNGRGLKESRAKAYAWYALAAANGIFLANNVTANLRRQMDSLERIDAELLRDEYFEKYK